MKQFVLIGLGGFLGSILRYAVSSLTQKWFASFPFGTLSVNLIGSLIIGMIVGFSVKNDQPTYWFLVMGFCGGFTTFSTFSLDGYHLLKNDMWLPFLSYTSISLIGGLILCMLGIWLAGKLV